MRLVDRAVLLGGLALLAAIGTALVGSPRTPQAQTGGVAPATPAMIREGVVGTIRTLNPLFVTTEPERDIDALIFRGLTRLGPDGDVVGDLAQAWQVAQNGRLYTFTLRSDARWHDGTPVTADDVVFTIGTLQHPAYTGAAAAPWRGIVAQRVSPLVVRFRLPNATAGFPLVARQPLLPAHVLGRVPAQQLAAAPFSTRPVGNGPFRLESLDRAGATLVAATPATSAGALGRPRVERYRLQLFTDHGQMLEAFRAGSLDIVGGLSPAEASSMAPLPGVREIPYPRPVLTTVVLNMRPQVSLAFRDARVRRALLAAVNRMRMVLTLLKGRGVIAETPISPASFAFDPKSAGTVPYDPQESVRLLVSAGWKRGGGGWLRPGTKRALEFELSAVEEKANPLAYAIAQQVAKDWARIGIKAVVRTYSIEQLAEKRLLPGTYAAAIVDVNLGLDPDLYPLLGSTQAVAGGTNLAGYQSRALDAQLIAARAYADAKTRRARFMTLQKSLAAAVPILPLFFGDYVMVVRERVQGPRSRAIARASDRYWDVLAWRLADGP